MTWSRRHLLTAGTLAVVLAVPAFFLARRSPARTAPTPSPTVAEARRIPVEPKPYSPPRALAGVNAASSPTGSTPRVLWTPEQQGVWKRMEAEKNPWFERLRTAADRSGTRQARYGDYGQWATLMYQITGRREYADKAWHQITHGLRGQSFLGTDIIPTGSSNFTREYFIDFVWMYDWLRPALSAEQRRLFLNSLHFWAEVLLERTPGFGSGPVKKHYTQRLIDSDATVGHYFGLVLLDLATKEDDPRAGEYHRDPKAGGLTADAPSLRTHLRDALAHYAETAKGGVWPEATGYNLGTLRLLFQGAQGARLLTRKDYYPEITQLQRDVALELIHELTPDLKTAWQWGDNQNLRSLSHATRITLMGMLVGLLQEEPEGAYLHQAMTELMDAAPPRGWEIHPPFFLFYNPYAPKREWRGQIARGLYAPNMGVMLFRTGWKEHDALLGAHFPGRTFVDHEHSWFGNFQLYRRGEWAITHPLGYQLTRGEYVNGMLIGGLSAMREVRGAVAQEFGPKEEYAYLAGITRGSYYGKDDERQPPAFLHEWTRSLLFLPAKDGRSDTLVFYDRVEAENPRNLPGLDRYYRADFKYLESFPALKQWVLHAVSRPVEGLDGLLEWATPGGQEVRLTPLLPPDRKIEVHDENVLWPAGYPYPAPKERAWQLRISPSSERRWDTFLNVLRVADGGRFGNVLVRSADGSAEGALLRREGLDDTLVLFGARPEGRVLKEGYTVEWSCEAAGTDLYLPDLHPRRRWTVSVDGAPARDLEVSEAGIGRLRVPGVGRHTLELKS